MNFLDILIIVPLCYAAWKGFQKGLIIEIFTLLALLVGIYCGVKFTELVSGGLRDKFSQDHSYLPIISFTLIFLVVGAMVYFAGKAIEKVVKAVQLSAFNKVAGGFFSLAKMAYIVSVLLVIWSSYDLENNVISVETQEKSLLYLPITNLSLSTIPALQESSFVQRNDSIKTPLSIDQALRAKELADSLGIETNDEKQLQKIYYDHEK